MKFLFFICDNDKRIDVSTKIGNYHMLFAHCDDNAGP